ncbi:hypothetical protein WDU94_013784 [Cyamophila willieti]
MPKACVCEVWISSSLWRNDDMASAVDLFALNPNCRSTRRWRNSSSHHDNAALSLVRPSLDCNVTEFSLGVFLSTARMKIQCYQTVSTCPNFGFVLPPVVDSSSTEYVTTTTQESLVKTSYKYPKKKTPIGTRVKTEGKVQLSNRPIEFSIEWLQRDMD